MNNNSNRLFHWTPSFNNKLDSRNSYIESDKNTNPNPNTNPNTNSDKNKKNINNNIKNTATISSLLSSALKYLAQRGCVLRCLRWMAGKYSTTLLSIRSGYILLRGKERSNSINIIYISIFFLIGIWFCLYFPSLFFYVTGINIYNYSAITDSTDSVYTMSVCIRQICANVLLFLLIYFGMFIIYKLKISVPILNKSIMGATCVIIKGGFEGLGDPELDENHVTQKHMRETFLEQTTQQVSHSKDNSTTFTRLNPEVNVIPVSYPPEGSNATSSNARGTTSGYPYWP
jgi:hypothetical protein